MFLSALDRIRRWHRLGRALVALLLTAAVAVALVLLLGLADAWSGFESGPRQTLVVILLAAAAGLQVASLVFAALFPRRRGAALADRLTTSSRQPASAGLSLTANSPDAPLARYLTEKSLEDATRELRQLPARKLIPWRRIGLVAAILLICLLPLGILRFAQPQAFATVAHRLLHPAADLPPWSPLNFAIEPAAPSCIYGGELLVSAEITGGELDFPVECLVRRTASGEIQRLPAFRESDTRFSRTLEGLTEPVSIAFACGRARSGWHPVEILLQPKVLAGRVTVAPPAYTGLAPVTTPLDSNELVALEGAELALELTSNRPLAPSRLTFTPAAAPGREAVPEPIEGELTSGDTIVFRWTVTRPGTVSATLHDVRGTPAAAPLDLSLSAIPDQPPAVDLESPPRLLLATPDSVVPLKGRAADDHALSRVQFVRTLQGFRDRARVVAPALREKQYQFADSLDLATVGVSPGETIELFLEASDHNPSLLGQGASEISQIQIISEEDYAYRIRAKTTLEQFSARFKAINDAVEESRESLENLADSPDAESLAKAAEAHEKAASLLDQLARDFPAFEIEERLNALAAGKASALRENLDALGKFDPGAEAAEREEAIDEMLDRLGRAQPEFDQLQQDARTLAEAGQVFEMAAKFQQIAANQKSVSERIRTIAIEISRGNDQNRRLLTALAETQLKNREALDEFAAELGRRAEAITDPALAPMKDSALEFLQQLALSDPASVMDLASESARLGQANDAFVSAELAHGLLEGLMAQPNPFAQACQGQCMSFSIPRPDVNRTMQQLLEALMCQNPGASPNQGTGGGGMGAGGIGPTGNAQPGFAMLDLPVLGPERMFFQPPSLGAGSDGSAGNSGGAPLDEAAEVETMEPAGTRTATGAAPDFDRVPAGYRDAVKTYFTPDEP